MTMEGQTRFVKAHSAGLAGLCAIAIALVVNVGIGKLSFKNPALRTSTAAAQNVASANIKAVPISVPEMNSVSTREAEPEVLSAAAETKPKPKVTLSRDQVWEVQAWLKAFKLDPGPVDGIPGPRTITAVKAFESSHQREETGNVDHALLGALRFESGQPIR
jgi:hypothetical protein